MSIKVTNKGKRLVATKFGVPYGLLLAYVKYKPVRSAIAISLLLALLLQVVLGLSTWVNLLVWLVIWSGLLWWSERHFDV